MFEWHTEQDELTGHVEISSVQILIYAPIQLLVRRLRALITPFVLTMIQGRGKSSHYKAEDRRNTDQKSNSTKKRYIQLKKTFLFGK